MLAASLLIQHQHNLAYTTRNCQRRSSKYNKFRSGRDTWKIAGSYQIKRPWFSACIWCQQRPLWLITNIRWCIATDTTSISEIHAGADTWKTAFLLQLWTYYDYRWTSTLWLKMLMLCISVNGWTLAFQCYPSEWATYWTKVTERRGPEGFRTINQIIS